MWQQQYTPLAGSLPLSALVAAIPIFVILILLGLMRKPAWLASLIGLGAAAFVAAFIYGMPLVQLMHATFYGAAYGLFPIGYAIFAAIAIYRVTVDSGKFEIIKHSIGSLTADPRLQTLLIAFAFSAFIEGASGFGTPVAVAGAMLAGLGYSPFYAATICLVANTVTVPYGSIGIPAITLALTTGLPIGPLGALIGRICAPLALFVPVYLVVVMSGWKGLRGVIPAVTVCGVAFAAALYAISNFVGVQLTNILTSFVAMGALLLLFRFWQPKDAYAGSQRPAPSAPMRATTRGEVALAWSPYILLVVLVLLWGAVTELNRVSIVFPWPGLHNVIQRMPPVAARPSAYAAMFTFNWLSASGTASLLAAALGALIIGMKPKQFAGVLGRTAKQLALAELTLAAVVGLAFLMNYSGMTATLGLAFAATGSLFPFFSPFLGWLGVFLTGSDTSANALFGNLQVVTAGRLGMNSMLMAAANAAGGAAGKMISLTSIAVAAAATGLKREEEALVFRFTVKHSLGLIFVLALVVTFYAYAIPWIAQ